MKEGMQECIYYEELENRAENYILQEDLEDTPLQRDKKSLERGTPYH